jgi:hypothetical protein
MPWSNVVACLIAGATLFGCMAIEPTGTLLMIAGIGWYINAEGGGEG